MILTPTSLPRLQHRLHWVLRVTVAMCFIGHGTWGVITKEGWLPFFQSQGIPDELAWTLMPMIGAVDILMGIAVVVKPRRIILMFMMTWALWTAILRPISGTPGTWEFWERAGNYLPPLMLLMLGGVFAMKAKDWFAGYVEPPLTEDRLNIIHFLGRLTIGLLLIGHGCFGAFVEKPMLIAHFASIGLPADLAFIKAVGWFEISLGVVVLLAPLRPLLWLVLVWKVFTEFLYVTEGGWLNLLEFIERAGDYGVPLAMILILNYRSQICAPTKP